MAHENDLPKSLYEFEDMQDFRDYKYDNFDKISKTYNAELKEHIDDYLYAPILEQVTEHPTDLTNLYWQWVVRFGLSAYDIHKITKKNDYDKPAFWCAERHGQSRTVLPDGREILVGGEYEDSYDPQFYIYNDVIVKHPDGNIEIFGYPNDVFLPTDFHTATLIDDDIWLIGSLGYTQHRNFNTTQIYRLNTTNYKITKVKSTNNIGWIHKHNAHFSDGKIIISGGTIERSSHEPLFENIDTWSLDINTLTWENLTNLQWQRFYVKKIDDSHLNLFTIGSLIFTKKNMSDMYQSEYESFKQLIGCEPNFEVFKALYCPPLDYTTHDEEQKYNTLAIIVDGIKVRYVDNMHELQVYIEGVLPNEKLQILQNDLKQKLSKIENTECVVCDIQ